MNKKIAIITDTHFGVRSNNHSSGQYFLKKQKKFFDEIFFPKIDEFEIDTIIHMGDVFEKRSNLNYEIFEKSKEFFFDPIMKRKIDTHVIIGNHDCPYTNTNKLNSPKVILEQSYNFKVYSDPEEVLIKNNKLLFLPWINSENINSTRGKIENSNSRYIFGHLEINGALTQKGKRYDKGLDRKTLSKFDKVFSGHFHFSSTEDNIWYLGNPTETTWSDYNNSKGFHILDLDDHSLLKIENDHPVHFIFDKLSDIEEDNLYDRIVRIDISKMTEDEIVEMYKRIDKFEKRPESFIFVNSPNFVENANADTQDLGIKSTKDILVEYVESMESEDKKYSEVKEILTAAYDKALEIV